MIIKVATQSDIKSVVDYLNDKLSQNSTQSVETTNWDTNVSKQQQRYYWGVILGSVRGFMSEEKPDIFGSWSNDNWDYELRMSFYYEKYTNGKGEVSKRPKRLALGKANKSEVANYFTNIISFFAGKGLSIPAPEELWWSSLQAEQTQTSLHIATERIRDAKYLEWVRSNKCLFCSTPFGTQAHHIRWGTDGGTGLKPSDCYCIPLCSLCHSKVHSDGEVSIYSKHSWQGFSHPKEYALSMYKKYKKTIDNQ